MSFYTALTGLNGSQADIAATSNNIANVGTTGFKRSRAEFGDIFATSPLQNSSSSIGSGSILKGVKQQFTQGNIAASLNALDLAISGQGFFALKPSLTSSQVVYTRNGSFNVDNNRNVVDSTGQFLLTYPVNEDGSVTSKTINDAVPLQLPVTSGEPKATSNIDLAINLPADAPVITDNPKFADGYQFSTSDPESFTNSTSLTIFDDLGNPTIATVYFIKTQAATADDPTNKYDTRLVIDETVINPDLVASVNDNNEQIYIDRFGNETTVANIPDDNYFSEGKGSALYRKDDLNQTIPSQPAKLTGSQSAFDFGEEGNKLIEITNDPMKFNATREAGNADSSIFWGKDFLLVNVDDGDVPVSIDLRPGFYNATQLADEVERAINDAYGDDNKLQVRSNVDDTLTVDFYTLNTGDGTLSGLNTPVSIDLLQSSYVTTQVGIDTSGSSPDFTREEFLAHAQVRIIDTMNEYVVDQGNDLGVSKNLFTRSSGAQMESIYDKTEVITFDYASTGTSLGPSEERHLVYSYYDKAPELDVYNNKQVVKESGNIVYDSSNNLLSIQVDDTSNFSVGEVVRLAGDFVNQSSVINGRELTILSIDKNNSITINTTGEGFPDGGFTLLDGASAAEDVFSQAYILSDKSTDVEAFFEGEHLSPAGAVNSYNNKKIVLRETTSAGHAFKHNEAGAGALSVSVDGALTTSPATEYYVTSIGTSDFTGQTSASISADGNTAVTSLSTSASAITLADTAATDVTDGTTYEVTSGSVTYNNVTYAAESNTTLGANAIYDVTAANSYKVTSGTAFYNGDTYSVSGSNPGVINTVADLSAAANSTSTKALTVGATYKTSAAISYHGAAVAAGDTFVVPNLQANANSTSDAGLTEGGIYSSAKIISYNAVSVGVDTQFTAVADITAAAGLNNNPSETPVIAEASYITSAAVSYNGVNIGAGGSFKADAADITAAAGLNNNPSETSVIAGAGYFTTAAVSYNGVDIAADGSFTADAADITAAAGANGNPSETSVIAGAGYITSGAAVSYNGVNIPAGGSFTADAADITAGVGTTSPTRTSVIAGATYFTSSAVSYNGVTISNGGSFTALANETMDNTGTFTTTDGAIYKIVSGAGSFGGAAVGAVGSFITGDGTAITTSGTQTLELELVVSNVGAAATLTTAVVNSSTTAAATLKTAVVNSSTTAAATLKTAVVNSSTTDAATLTTAVVNTNNEATIISSAVINATAGDATLTAQIVGSSVGGVVVSPNDTFTADLASDSTAEAVGDSIIQPKTAEMAISEDSTYNITKGTVVYGGTLYGPGEAAGASFTATPTLASSTTLVDGVDYTVTEGSVTYDGVVYGPAETAGASFSTKDPSYTVDSSVAGSGIALEDGRTYTVTSGTVKVNGTVYGPGETAGASITGSTSNTEAILEETDSADATLVSAAKTAISAYSPTTSKILQSTLSTSNILSTTADIQENQTLGTIFTASVETLEGTGRVKPIMSFTDIFGANSTVATGKVFKLVSGEISDGTNKYGPGAIITKEVLATGSAYSILNGSTPKFITHDEVFSGLTSQELGGTDSLANLGMDATSFANKTAWVDEKNPPIKISYDAVNQRFEFGVNHTAIGPGTDSNYRAFKVYGASDADGTNNIGIPASDSSPQTEISSTAVISAASFVADGGEMQINAKRFGASVVYNSDTKTFTFLSGTTGETIKADGALGVDNDQNASNIQVGRYAISATDGSVVNASFDTATRYMGNGDNGLMGVGASKGDTAFENARGLASQPASAVGASATEPLSEIFNLSSTGNANVFNVSVNGISGIIQVPSGNYVGSTLAAELQTRINQISDDETGKVVGGVTVKYQADTNNFVFTTGTTGDQSTIKVKGAAKLGLDDVPLGVGSVPTIVNLVQAKSPSGVPLFVNSAGEIVETPPATLVTDYYPLYVDEGELTFDKTGQIISPLNRVHYEQQAAGFSISLDVDYSASTQLSQPFAVNNLEQDGFTSGRLDGLDIDATGLLRANYTNGENRPLGKIVLANFNNQNGLKQIGNATFVETATSGTPTFGEAGAEGFGSIQSGSLERSNVDITEELVNLITAQRNFQASSKAIETSTQLTQAIINIRS